MGEQIVRVIRGVIDVPNTSPTALTEQRLIDRLAPGFGARSFKHVQRYHVGQHVTLSASEAARLMAAGIVAIVS